MNAQLKYNATIKAIKERPHDLVFIFGSDDFFHVEFFKKCIDSARAENGGAIAFCNGKFNPNTRLGGIRIIDFATSKSFILTKVNCAPKVKAKYKGYTSFSMGAFGFSKAALEKINYELGSSEIYFEQILHDAGVKKIITPQLYYDVKTKMTISTFEKYAEQSINSINMTTTEINEYLKFMDMLKTNVPTTLQFRD